MEYILAGIGPRIVLITWLKSLLSTCGLKGSPFLLAKSGLSLLCCTVGLSNSSPTMALHAENLSISKGMAVGKGQWTPPSGSVFDREGATCIVSPFPALAITSRGGDMYTVPPMMNVMSSHRMKVARPWGCAETSAILCPVRLRKEQSLRKVLCSQLSCGSQIMFLLISVPTGSPVIDSQSFLVIGAFLSGPDSFEPYVSANALEIPRVWTFIWAAFGTSQPCLCRTLLIARACARQEPGLAHSLDPPLASMEG